ARRDVVRRGRRAGPRFPRASPLLLNGSRRDLLGAPLRTAPPLLARLDVLVLARSLRSLSHSTRWHLSPNVCRPSTASWQGSRFNLVFPGSANAYHRDSHWAQ